jgi:lysophospholipase L1-like esterase
MLSVRWTSSMVAGGLLALGCGSSDESSSGGNGAQGGSGGSTATGGSTASGGSSATGGTGGGGGNTAAQCFADISDGPSTIDYDQFAPIINSSCSGTNHQQIEGVEQIVYLGDSITNGDFVSPKYVDSLTPQLTQKFPGATVKDCSEGGARNDDFLMGGNQIPTCFPSGGDSLRTLVVMTMGGNDLAAMAKDHISLDLAMQAADVMLQQLRDAVVWLKDPAKFPNGSFVVFANVYEYTDGSANLSSCPAASIAGFSGSWPEGMPVLPYINEGYMKIAVDTQSDMIFMFESFCGHGFANTDSSLQCYRGPDTPQYFDFTCIHPNAEGANVITTLFFNTISE